MSIKLMSAIFETEFPDYLTCGEDKTKASTAKLILLAIADHANDEGESAYPGLKRLGVKTGLSKTGIIDTLKILKFNGLIFVDEEPSRLGTNNYTIITSAYPCLQKSFEVGSQATLLVNPLDHGGQPTLPVVVNPLDMNHPLTINKSSLTTTTNISKEVFKTYQSEIGIITPRIADTIGLWIDDPTCPSEWLLDVMKIAADQNKRNWAYCEAILKRWMVEGKTDIKKTPAGPKYSNKQAELLRQLENA